MDRCLKVGAQSLRERERGPRRGFPGVLLRVTPFYPEERLMYLV